MLQNIIAKVAFHEIENSRTSIDKAIMISTIAFAKAFRLSAMDSGALLTM